MPSSNSKVLKRRLDPLRSSPYPKGLELGGYEGTTDWLYTAQISTLQARKIGVSRTSPPLSTWSTVPRRRQTHSLTQSLKRVSDQRVAAEYRSVIVSARARHYLKRTSMSVHTRSLSRSRFLRICSAGTFMFFPVSSLKR